MKKATDQKARVEGIKKQEIPGYNERITPRSRIRVIEIDIEADPAKRGPEFEAEARRLMGNEKDFRREYKRDWTAAAGTTFYAEFTLNGGRPTYLYRAKSLLAGPIWRGWDWGYRKPACIWMQRSPKSGRVFIYREIMPEDIDSYTFIDLVKYLSGQLDYDDLAPEVLGWVYRIQSERGLPPPPWFPRGIIPTQFIDISGPECFKVNPDAPAHQKERSAYEIAASKGVILNAPGVGVGDREAVIRKLLKVTPQQDGTIGPGMLIDPACPLFLAALEGGLVFAAPTRQDPLPNAPKKDGHYENIHDAAGYPLVQLVPLVEEEAPSGYVYPGGGRIAVSAAQAKAMEDETVGWYETREGNARFPS